MLEIFIAVIGLIYYLSRISTDVGNNKKYDRMIQKTDDWAANYSNHDMQLAIERDLIANDQQKMDELDEICKEVPLYKKYRDEAIEQESKPNKYGWSHVWASIGAKLIMAKRGLASRSSDMHGCFGVTITHGERCFDNREWYEMKQEVMFWIEKQLQAHGVPGAELVCVRRFQGDGISTFSKSLVCDGHLARYIEKDIGRVELYWDWKAMRHYPDQFVSSFDELVPELQY